jgi:transcriptional regulator with XRE-family HTH domain
MPPIDPVNLAHRVRARRLARGLSLQQAAAVTKVSAATMSRVERGDYLPGRENLVKLAEWLDIPIDQLGDEALLAGHGGEPESTPEAVALHLRADRKLSADDADALEQMFRLAYDRLSRRRQPQRR